MPSPNQLKVVLFYLGLWDPGSHYFMMSLSARSLQGYHSRKKDQWTEAQILILTSSAQEWHLSLLLPDHWPELIQI